MGRVYREALFFPRIRLVPAAHRREPPYGNCASLSNRVHVVSEKLPVRSFRGAWRDRLTDTRRLRATDFSQDRTGSFIAAGTTRNEFSQRAVMASRLHPLDTRQHSQRRRNDSPNSYLQRSANPALPFRRN